MASVGAGVSIFSLQDAIVKGMSGSFPLHEIVFVRSLVALPILVLVTVAETRELPRFGRAWLHLLRGLLMFGAFTCYYLSMARLQIAEAVALFFVAPLFVVGLSAPVLGERVQKRSWIAIGVGGLGALLITRPGAVPLELASLLAVIGALCYALSVFCVRRLGVTQSGGSMALSAAFVYLLASGGTGLALAGAAEPADAGASLHFLLHPWLWPDARNLALMAACGLISAVAFFCLGQGYRLAEASRAAPFEYLSLPWGMLWGYIFFANLPSVATVAGALLIAGGGLYALGLERNPRRGKAIIPKPID